MNIDIEKFKEGYEGDFVVHEHHAKRHHLDLRLEVPVVDVSKALGTYQKRRTDETQEPDVIKSMPQKAGNVLMSFALPKAKIPTKDEKFLAKEVECHPYSYLKFEGEIPKGSYGAGDVSVFDVGKYKVLEYTPDKMVISFNGNKLKGDHALVKMDNKDWLFLKKKASQKIWGQSNTPVSYSQNNITATFDGTNLSVSEGMNTIGIMSPSEMPDSIRKALFESERESDKFKALETAINIFTTQEKKKARLFVRLIRKYAMFLKEANLLDYVHPGLDLNVWDLQGNLRRRHQKLILSTLSDFLEREQLYNYTKWIKHIYLVGSLTSYQYHNHSDADIHVIVDIPEFINQEMGGDATVSDVKEKLNELKRKINTKNFIVLKKTKHPVEFYFETDKESHGHDGIYDVVERRWIAPPRTVDPDFDPEIVYSSVLDTIKEVANELDVDLGRLRRDVINAKLLDEAIESFQPALRSSLRIKLDQKLEVIESEIEALLRKKEKFKQDRREKFNPESFGNLQFKFLQRFGYIDALKKLEEVMRDEKVDARELSEIEDILKLE